MAVPDLEVGMEVGGHILVFGEELESCVEAVMELLSALDGNDVVDGENAMLPASDLAG